MAQMLLKTPLHDRHAALRARMVPFAGWEMPVQYEGVIPEHLAVRADCGVFDVSHMGEFEVEGPPRAVQGRRAIARLGLPEAAQFTFAEGEIDGIQCMVNRTGYTGEKGCEVLVMAEDAGDLWDRVLERGAVPCGLGARDTLRIEASLPLHGNDITPDTDAISAGLGWCCALEKEFSGAEELRELKARGPERKLVSFVMDEKAIPRQGMAIEGGGEVTSGTHSPMLDRGIGMGYVLADSATPDTQLTIDVRGKLRRARVVKRPIYQREEYRQVAASESYPYDLRDHAQPDWARVARDQGVLRITWFA